MLGLAVRHTIQQWREPDAAQNELQTMQPCASQSQLTLNPHTGFAGPVRQIRAMTAGTNSNSINNLNRALVQITQCDATMSMASRQS